MGVMDDDEIKEAIVEFARALNQLSKDAEEMGTFKPVSLAMLRVAACQMGSVADSIVNGAA